MDFRVELTGQAKSDIAAIHAWLVAQEAGDAGARWFTALSHAIDSLRALPTRCPVAPESREASVDVRQLLYGRRPHVYRPPCHNGLHGPFRQFRRQSVLMHSMAPRPLERGMCALATLGWVFLAFGFLAARAPEGRQAERAFEVASVAPSRSGNAQMVIRTPPSGLVSATNVTVAMLLRYAYDIPEFRIVDAPAWVATEHFDVTARGHANATVRETRQMIRGLLADRFSVVLRTAQREMSMDVLTRAGASPGPQLRPSSAECPAEGTPLPVQPSDPPQCTLRVAFGRISGTGQRIADLVGALGRLTRRHVVDETALAGRYDFVLVYTPDAVALDTATPAEFPAIDPDGPALSTALQEQLGLRLRTTRGPVDVLVVERVLPPTPN